MNFRISFLFSFLFGILTMLYFVRQNPLAVNAPHNTKSKNQKLSFEYLQKIPPTWLAPSRTLNQAKWSHDFWTYSPDQTTPNFTLDVLNNPDLFSIFFPGYPNSMRLDTNFWTIYFHRNFDQKIQLQKISSLSEYTLLVSLPWVGCLDIYKKYGADILLIGASDLAQDIMIDALANRLNSEMPHVKILSCSTPGMTASMILDFIKTLKKIETPQKIKWTIIGLGPSGFLSKFPFEPSIQYAKADALADFLKKKSLGNLEIINQPWSLPLHWDDVVPVRKASEHLPLNMSLKIHSTTDVIPARWSLHPNSFSKESLNYPDQIHTLLSTQPIDHPFIQQELTAQECYPPEHNQHLLFQIKEDLKKISDQTLLFLIPTLGYELQGLPNCFLKDLKIAFEKNSDEHTKILFKSATEYKLNYLDFILNDSSKNGFYKIDLVHANKYGAEKITSAVAKEILQPTQ